MRRAVLAGLLVALVLLSGCVKINIWEEVKEGGMSDVKIEVDLSNFPTEEGQEIEDPCLDIDSGEDPGFLGTETNKPSLENMKCSFANQVLTVTGQLDRTKTEALEIDGQRYNLNIKQGLWELNDEENQGFDQDPEQLETLKAAGFEYNYFVKMPGSVKGQKGGEIQEDGSVKFDVTGIEEDWFVESEAVSIGLETVGTEPVSLVVIGVVVLAAIAVLVLFLKRRRLQALFLKEKPD